MNILMLLFKDIHLDARVQREAKALAEAGYKVDIACLRERDEDPVQIHPDVHYIRISLTTKRIKRAVQSPSEAGKQTHPLLKFFRTPIAKLIKDIYAQWEYMQKVYGLMSEKKYVVIHCHDLNTLPAGVYLKRKSREIKLVYDSHELFNEMVGKNKIERWVGYQLEERLIRLVDHLITVNPYVEKFFGDRYGDIPSTVIQNTPIWEDFEKPPKNYWRERYNIDKDEVILLYQGGLTPQRGLEECIDAMLMLPDRYKFILLGEGPLRNRLEVLVKHKGLDDRVFFHEPVPPTEILKLTSQADIGLVMYKNTCLNNYMSTPNKIFEYFLSGIPTVASDHPGKRYIVQELGTGVCVEETAEAISQGILNVMSDYEKYRNYCLVNRDKYTWSMEKQKLIVMYRELWC